MVSTGQNSRLCALNCLVAVLENHKPLDVSLDNFAKKYDLLPQDKSFAHALCGFVLRYKPALQNIVNIAANRTQDITPSALNIILLMGVAQIILMDVADHAAVNTSVELTYKIKCSKQKGLVNAILRRVIREDKPEIKPSLPEWLLQSWEKDYGKDCAHKIADASLKEAKVGITHKDGTWRCIEKFDVLSHDEWAQDFSSYFPVHLLGDLHNKVVFDLCAAPGGKTMQLASKGAKVVSVDVSMGRLNRLRENLVRTELESHVDIICADILKWKPEMQADIILLDAPCSATGTIRRHPDLPYIRTPKDIEALVHIQSQLLEKILPWVAPNGMIIYCTCSLQKPEGEQQISNFLNKYPDFSIVKYDAFTEYQNENGTYRLLPTYQNMDGFFIAVLKRK